MLWEKNEAEKRRIVESPKLITVIKRRPFIAILCAFLSAA